jgi:hypothetical protein
LLNAAMLYIFRVVGTGCVKMGFTRGDVWKRVATGFWSNVHPATCCGRLGWDNLELLACFDGDEKIEAAIKEALPPHTGEFWPDEQITELLGLCWTLCGRKFLPEPERPEQPPEVQRRVEKLPCCGVPRHVCNMCRMSFQREHHMRQHQESCTDRRISCAACQTRVLRRNLKRHLRNCRVQRVAAAIDSE